MASLIDDLVDVRSGSYLPSQKVRCAPVAVRSWGNCELFLELINAARYEAAAIPPAQTATYHAASRVAKADDLGHRRCDLGVTVVAVDLHRFLTPIVPVDSSHTVPTPLIVPIARIPRGSPFNRTRSRHHRIAADVHRYGLVMVTCIVTDCGGDHRFAVVARD
eukprot:CAMPEP_0119492222 /NCGR_PEP_ID=MMETSP1344-20130328/16841_1 /TAXON_ID=236787 /ORGANISM="Florenciella parvula, Strain CCMP2471" /LENGTH=162 /DNA_ID=CAMNT_0007527537 /DNA_START=350 /DNA_END=840 /DNA_ORIENTATION=+